MVDTERPWEPDARRAVVEHTALDPAVAYRIRRRLERPARRPPLLFGALLATAVAAGLAWAVLGARSPGSGAPPSAYEHVSFDFGGEGAMVGTQDAPHLRWHDGTVRVEVEPNQGVQLTVSTEEATVRVVGTAFSVTREAHATEVHVDHGEVRVTCASQPERRLTDGEHLRCLPDELPALLLRASALAAEEAAAADRLETLDRADALAANDAPAAGELLAHRVRALEDADRLDEAAAAAERYLAQGYPARRGALLGFVARHRYAREGCEALPRLEEAVAALGPGGEALLLASCLVATDPDRARALVDASAEQVDASWAEALQQLEDALGEGEPSR